MRSTEPSACTSGAALRMAARAASASRVSSPYQPAGSRHRVDGAAQRKERALDEGEARLLERERRPRTHHEVTDDRDRARRGEGHIRARVRVVDRREGNEDEREARPRNDAVQIVPDEAALPGREPEHDQRREQERGLRALRRIVEAMPLAPQHERKSRGAHPEKQLDLVRVAGDGHRIGVAEGQRRARVQERRKIRERLPGNQERGEDRDHEHRHEQRPSALQHATRVGEHEQREAIEEHRHVGDRREPGRDDHRHDRAPSLFGGRLEVQQRSEERQRGIDAPAGEQRCREKHHREQDGGPAERKPAQEREHCSRQGRDEQCVEDECPPEGRFADDGVVEVAQRTVHPRDVATPVPTCGGRVAYRLLPRRLEAAVRQQEAPGGELEREQQGCDRRGNVAQTRGREERRSRCVARRACIGGAGCRRIPALDREGIHRCSGIPAVGLARVDADSRRRNVSAHDRRAPGGSNRAPAA